MSTGKSGLTSASGILKSYNWEERKNWKKDCFLKYNISKYKNEFINFAHTWYLLSQHSVYACILHIALQFRALMLVPKMNLFVTENQCNYFQNAMQCRKWMHEMDVWMCIKSRRFNYFDCAIKNAFSIIIVIFLTKI